MTARVQKCWPGQDHRVAGGVGVSGCNGAPAAALSRRPTLVTTTSTTEARTGATLSQQTTTVASDTAAPDRHHHRAVGWPGSRSPRSAAFDAAGSGGPATGGNMDFWGDFAAINVSLGDSIAFTINVKVFRKGQKCRAASPFSTVLATRKNVGGRYHGFSRHCRYRVGPR